jgi:hypothetical protein
MAPARSCALQAQRRAEELQRRQPSEHERFIDGLPGLSDRKRSFLKSNPALTRPDVAEIAGRHYQDALASGVADDRDAIESYVIQNTARDLHQREKAAALSEHRPLPLPASPMPQPAPAATLPPSARKSIPMSAPVDRNPPSLSGRQREPNNTLSAEERIIARNSFSAPGMSNETKELLYLKNRNRYQAMKQDGTYSDQGGGG